MMAKASKLAVTETQEPPTMFLELKLHTATSLTFLWMFVGSTCYLLVKLFQVYNILRSAWLAASKEALTSAVYKQIVWILEDSRNFYHTRLHQDDFSRNQQISFLLFLLDNIIPNVWYVQVILPPSFSMT
jgi:hypothetical protein